MNKTSITFEAIREKIAASFKQQSIMDTLGASIASIEQGEVIIKLPFKQGISQQDGFVHAGVITTIVDSACGYAAMTQMPENARVLTIEFKSNFLAPAQGDVFFAKGMVKKSGKTLTVTTGEVYAHSHVAPDLISTEPENGGKLIALMQATMITLEADT